MKREDARSQKPSNKSTSRIRRASARLAADASRAFQPVVSIAPTAAVTGSDIVNTILVFWNGSENNPAVLGAWKDTNYLQGDGGGQWKNRADGHGGHRAATMTLTILASPYRP